MTTRRKGASGTCWRSRRIQETLGGRSSIETTLAVLRFRNRLVIEAWHGCGAQPRCDRNDAAREMFHFRFFAMRTVCG